MINFQYPLFLVLIPIILIIYYLNNKIKRSNGIGYSEITLLKLATQKSNRTKIPRILRLLTLSLLVLALSGPVEENSYEETKASGIDIILAIDVSQSMDGLDFSTKTKEQTRLDAVKTVVKQFIDSRPNDRIGVVAFGGRPYLASPLTLDHQWIFKRVDILETGMIEGGTAIGSAIASASNHLNNIESKSKIIVLLTDGENNSGAIEPGPAAEAAKALGIKIYTVGAGKDGQAPYKVNGFFGTDYQYIDVNIDEEMLNNIAETTGGLYFRARDIESLESIYDKINDLETTERVANKSIVYNYYFIYVLIAALTTLLIELILTSTILRKTF